MGLPVPAATVLSDRAGRVGRVHPEHGFGLLCGGNVKVDGHRLAVAAAQHTFQRLGSAGVDFLVWHVGRHIDEVARPGFGGELQLVAPTHAGTALDHVDDAFQMPVVVGAGSWRWRGMVTVPAHSFSAPTRAKLMAALRSMPGVWAVLLSSWLPGTTPHAVVFPRLVVRVAVGMVVGMAHRGAPWVSVDQGSVHQVAEQLPVFIALVGRLYHQHCPQFKRRVQKESGAGNATPVRHAHRAGAGGNACGSAHRKAQPEAITR